MPLVNRYDSNLNVLGSRFSDLARMANKKEWIEEKQIRLVTDAYGFRNDATKDLGKPLDVIILGDSIGAGGVSQENTWTSIFANIYHLNTYNLSVPGSGPWQEYVTAWVEKGRLKTRGNTFLVWQLFSGNDLDDVYGPMDPNVLPWRGVMGRTLVRVDSFRARSPVRRLLEARDRSADVLSFDFLNGRKLLFYRPYTVAALRTREQITRHPNFERLSDTISAVRKIANESGWQLLIVLVPTKEEVYSWVWKRMPPWSPSPEPSGLSSVLKELCGVEGINYLDLGPPSIVAARQSFEQSEKLLYWYDDTHPNTEGSHFAASLIYDRLISLGAKHE